MSLGRKGGSAPRHTRHRDLSYLVLQPQQEDLMISKTSQRFALVVVACLASGALLAADDIPLRPGPPPSMAEAARIINASRASSGYVLTPETHIVNPPALIFQTMAP